MARKDFTFHGMTPEQLQALPEQELLKTLNARARRTLKRLANNPQKVIAVKNIRAIIKANKASTGKTAKKARTHRRDLIVLPEMIGQTISVYSGKAFEDLTIAPEMVGHFLGEFVLTRKKVQHGQAGIGSSGGSRHVAKK